MDLFGYNPQENILPLDGEAYYFGAVISPEAANAYFKQLQQQIAWQADHLVLYDKAITTARKVAWHGDQPYAYRYSQQTKIAQPWLPTLLELKNLVEQQIELLTSPPDKPPIRFNSCLLNLYHTGNEGMAWHSDDEAELGEQAIIASLSLGAARKFSFKHKCSKKRVDVVLEDGSLLIMKGETQQCWQHSLPKTTRVKDARINLTYRKIITQ